MYRFRPLNGGTDPGASNHFDPSNPEKVINLDLGNRLGNILRCMGHTTIYTRDNDTLTPLGDRGKIAIDNGCNYFISLHCNSSPSDVTHGVEIYCHGKGTTEEILRSQKLAEEIDYELRDWVPEWGGAGSRVKKDTTIYSSGFAVLRDTYQKMPAILFECGFLSNKGDTIILKDPLKRENTICAIASAIVKYDWSHNDI